MPDVPIRPKPPEPPTVAERLEPAAIAARVILTGDPNGRVRRPLLFSIAMLGSALAPSIPVFAVVAIVAIVLLAYTDQIGVN